MGEIRVARMVVGDEGRTWLGPKARIRCKGLRLVIASNESWPVGNIGSKSPVVKDGARARFKKTGIRGIIGVRFDAGGENYLWLTPITRRRASPCWAACATTLTTRPPGAPLWTATAARFTPGAGTGDFKRPTPRTS